MSIRNIFDKGNLNIKKILKYAGVHVLDHIIMNHARWECFSFARARTVQENGGESTVRKLTNLVALVLSVVMLLVVVVTPDCSAEEHASVVKFIVGKTAVTSNRATVLTMPVPAVFDAASKQLLLPVRSVAKLLEWDLAWDAKTGSCTLTSGKSRVVVKVGSRTAMVGAKAVTMSAALLNARGTVVGPVDVLRFMGASVQVAPDGRSCTATIASVQDTAGSGDSGSEHPDAVTRMSRSVTYATKKYTFEIIRIDLKGKGIRVVPVASPGGMNSGAPYTTFALGKPLAMINALPFDTTTHVMTGSLGGEGIYPQVKAGYAETMGIDDHGIPFYAEGRLEVRADVMVDRKTISMTTYSINNTSWGGFTVYTNWYPKAILVGSNQQLIVVDRDRIVQRVCGATFQPRLMKPGQYALYGYQAAVNHRTIDTITSLRNADSAHLHIFLGERDLSTGFFIQSAPVVLRDGQPVMGAKAYADSFRMAKSGPRSFLGIGGRYLYFVSSSTSISLTTDNVGGALAQLKLFSDVISLDGGASTTLYYKGAYIYTPGRQLVTCLVVSQ